jgi:hypothetical protein
MTRESRFRTVKPNERAIEYRRQLKQHLPNSTESAFFSQFPETRPSGVPRLLDTEVVKVFEDAAA